MTNVQDKAKLIGSILRATKKVGSTKHFDLLNEKSEAYLGKLLTVCKNLKKAK